MRVGICLWLWLLGLALKAGAAPWAMRVLTTPERAEVYLITRGGMPGANRRLLGYSGDQLVIQVPSLQNSLTLSLEHPDCEPLVVEVKKDDLRAGATWPANGAPISLPYRSGRRYLYLLPYLGGLALLGLGAFLWQRRRSGQVELQRQLEDQRAHLITRKVVSGEAGDPIVGGRLDDYRVVELLGQGGMARVYRALPEESLDESQAVAIKLLNPELSEDEEVVRRFDREKMVYEALRHPNIVRIFGAGSHGGRYYIVMEYVRGRTLREHMGRQGMSPRQAVRLLEPALEAVAFANRKGVIHRDLKPENLMLDTEGKLKVMDFGLARGQDYQRVTATGAVLGTPAYMAPEQIQGNLDLRIDQYAFGVILFEMISGQLPFYDENPVTVIIKHLNEAPPQLVQFHPEWSKISEVVDRMLAKNPEERYRDLEYALKILKYTAEG